MTDKRKPSPPRQVEVVDDLGTAIVEHQLGGSAFRSADGQSRCFAALERPLSSWPR